LFCEICGREIVGKPGRSLVEGATLIVCQQCSSIGTKLPSFSDRPPRRPMIAPSHTHAPIERLPKAVEESDLIEEYQKIEIGKMLPTMRLSKELEHILRVRLLVPREELELPSPPRKASPSPVVTLGDVALVKHRGEADE